MLHEGPHEELYSYLHGALRGPRLVSCLVPGRLTHPRMLAYFTFSAKCAV